MGEGFEPPGPARALRFSRPVHSTRLCHPTVEIRRNERAYMSNIGLHDHLQLVPVRPGFGLKKGVKGTLRSEDVLHQRRDRIENLVELLGVASTRRRERRPTAATAPQPTAKLSDERPGLQIMF